MSRLIIPDKMPWDVSGEEFNAAVSRICKLADNGAAANRAIAWVALVGADVHMEGTDIWVVKYQGRRFGSWLYRARAAVAFCIAMDLNIET